MNCIGLDVGSTSIKGAVLDIDAAVVRDVVRAPFPEPINGLPPSFVEIDPAAVVKAAAGVLTALLEREPAPAGVFVAGQMAGMILVDAEGAPLTNYVSWRDQRTLQATDGRTFIEAVRSCWSDDEFAQLGRELQPGSVTSLLFWLADHAELPRGARVSTIADFTIGRICRAAPRMHRSHGIGLLDLRSGDWHREALRQIGLDLLEWPEPVELSAPVGTLRADVRAIPCYAALGDQQCALFGADLERDELSINVSTGSQVSRRTQHPEPGEFQTRFYPGGDYLNTITHIPAGRSLNVLVDFITEYARRSGADLSGFWEYLSQAVETSDGGGLECDLSFFKGPCGDTGRIGGITTENLTIANLFRAAFASMTGNYAACAVRLRPREFRRIALTGGLPQSVPLLRRLIVERFGRPVREPAAAEETLLGLLRAATAVLQRGESL